MEIANAIVTMAKKMDELMENQMVSHKLVKQNVAVKDARTKMES